jgi:aminoglycoside phosphotransferase (APT) family kinase protein
LTTTATLEEGLARYLAATGRDGSVELVGRLSGGWSVATFHVRAGGRDLVLRCADEGHPLRTNAAREARIMRCAADAGVLVPEVVAVEDDPTWLGAPFSLVALVEGSAPNVWSRSHMAEILRPTTPEALLTELVDLALRIQTIPLEPAASQPASTLGMTRAEYGIAADVRRWRAMLDATVKPRPALRLAGRWLADNAAPDGDVVFQHHDFRLGNLLVDDAGRPSAVLDWEFSGAGDPLCDIAYAAQPYTLGRLMSSSGFLEVDPDASTWVRRDFIARSDTPIEHDRLDWFVALGIFKMAVALVVPADRWWRDEGTKTDAWLELPILSLTEDLITAIRGIA